jgi:adenylylsulfate kinase
VKGLYKKALNREIKYFTGITDPFEEPQSPEMIIETDRVTPEESAAKIIAFLEEHRYI